MVVVAIERHSWAQSCRHLERTISHIHELGAKAGVALNPATPLSVLDYILPEVDMVLIMSVNPGFGGQKFIDFTFDKIKELRSRVNKLGLNTDIEVDGGICLDNVSKVLKAGANVIVAGTAVFGGDIFANTSAFTEVLQRGDKRV